MWPGKSQQPGHDAKDAEPTNPSRIPARKPGPMNSPPRSPRTSQDQPHLWGTRLGREPVQSPGPSERHDQPDPGSMDRVFPIRSVVSVDPTPTPTQRSDRGDGYFQSPAETRKFSTSQTPNRARQGSADGSTTSTASERSEPTTRAPQNPQHDSPAQARKPRASAQLFSDLAGSKAGSDHGTVTSEPAPPHHSRTASMRSGKSYSGDDGAGLVTSRFKHVVSEGGHAVITGRDGDTLQRCEDEPIHIPGAVQGFGLLLAVEEEAEGKLVVRVVSENSKRLIGYTPKQLFALESFTDILSEEQADNLLDHIDFIRDEDADVSTNGPDVFTISIRSPQRRSQKLWCAVHINERHPDLIICEFELEDDPTYPLVPPNDATPEPPEDTLSSDPTPQEYAESTLNSSRPLRVLRSARKRKGDAAAMEIFNIMSQVQEQLAAAPNLDVFLKILVGVVKELTGFHRVMIYQFDQSWNGRVVTELVDPRATKDLYKGLNFPASDIPKQAREMYKVNKVRMLYDRDHETARLVCRTVADLENPLDLTFSYLRAMSPIHLKYLANMAVRSSMSISINAFEELWGLIACHSYGSRGMRVSFPIRKMCRLIGDSASRNIERLSYASRLQARKLINTVPTQNNPSGYIIASSEDLLKLFDADFGLLSIRDETKILGQLEQSQEALAMLEYFRMRKMTNVMTSQDIAQDFPDLRYAPGFKVIAGLLLVPLSVNGHDFIVFFRKGQLKEVKWAGNPYEKFIKAGTEGYLEPRKSFKTWSETVVGKCREWTEEEVETAAVLCLVYGKFIEVWRQKEAALQSSQLTRLLLANSAHEVRTPLNAIINYLEIALEGSLDQETRDNLAKSHSASKSLIYVINDLLDLTKTEEGGDLIKDEPFELSATLHEATEAFKGDAKRKQISYEVIEHPGLPSQVIGDQRRIRQAISNVTANAIQNTTKGGVTVEMWLVSQVDRRAEIQVSVTDTGSGISNKRLDALFRELEQVQTEGDIFQEMPINDDQKAIEPPSSGGSDKRILGLGLAVVARIIRNMNGQLRLKSEEGKGSRFVLQFPFDLPDSEPEASVQLLQGPGEPASMTSSPDTEGEVTLIEPDRGGRSPVESRSPTVRKTSADSFTSKRSLRSTRSTGSASSARSEADRLIDAISEPHMVGTPTRAEKSSSSRPGSSHRPSLTQRHTAAAGSSVNLPRPHRAKSIEASPASEALQKIQVTSGSAQIPGQRTPVRPVRLPDEAETNSPTTIEDGSQPRNSIESSREEPAETNQAPNADHMAVLVAEDDPVNSRIIKKRLEKLGHDVTLTPNGEECSSSYGERSGFYDAILMDMQMPIVDGLTSTKMIRSFEKSHPTHILSTRASLNGRIPIIAVSASLEENQRQNYIDAGFDGWILKPISFVRVSELLTGIVDMEVRGRNLYKKGEWERGGWFDQVQKDVFAADTKPDDAIPMSAPSEGVKIAAATDSPFVKEEGTSLQSEEQNRMAASQDKLASEREEKDGAGTVPAPT